MIKETRHWNVTDMINLCVKNDFYNAGSFEDYDNMLSIVRNHRPTPDILEYIARDILEHTDGQEQTVTNIMTIIINDIVTIAYSDTKYTF